MKISLQVSKKLTMTIAAFMLSNLSLAENTLSASNIISQSNKASYYAGDDGRAEARMLIVDSNGNKQMRQFTILRRDIEDEGDQDMLVFFSRPSDVKDTVFRVHKNVSGDDDRWLYLPAMDLVKRISAGDKRTSFVGAHFYYEDVSGRNPREDDFEIIGSTGDRYKLKATPKDTSSVEFSYYEVDIDKTTFLPMEATYYNEVDKAIRKMEVLKVTEIEGVPTVMHSRMSQLSDNSFTEMQFRNVNYDLGLPQDIFSERSLRSPPKNWLK